MFKKFLNGNNSESALIFELFQAIEAHKSAEIMKKSKNIFIRLYDHEDNLSLEFKLSGFNYMKIKEKLQDLGKSFCPSAQMQAEGLQKKAV